ncbi:MAG: DUF6375 family protein [Pyrinomonadaceae bacterium]
MKIWNSYGSEHSSNLVMIGTFTEIASAKRAEEIIDEITSFMADSEDDHEEATSFSDSALALLHKVGVHTLRPAELAQFRYDVRTERNDKKIVITTDEYDISGFLKILIDEGARVEVYSAHLNPDTGLGR